MKARFSSSYTYGGEIKASFYGDKEFVELMLKVVEQKVIDAAKEFDYDKISDFIDIRGEMIEALADLEEEARKHESN